MARPSYVIAGIIKYDGCAAVSDFIADRLADFELAARIEAELNAVSTWQAIHRSSVTRATAEKPMPVSWHICCRNSRRRSSSPRATVSALTSDINVIQSIGQGCYRGSGQRQWPHHVRISGLGLSSENECAFTAFTIGQPPMCCPLRCREADAALVHR